MNNKAQGNLWIIIVLIASIVSLVLLIFLFSIGGAIVKETTDTIIPTLNDVGDVGNGINFSKGTAIATAPVDSIVSNFSMITLIVFIIGVIGLFTLAFVFRGNFNGWTLALFFASVVGVILVCILISNAYENLYTGTNNLAVALQGAGLVSYLILHSPKIMTIISFIAGIILFSGNPEEALV